MPTRGKTTVPGAATIEHTKRTSTDLMLSTAEALEKCPGPHMLGAQPGAHPRSSPSSSRRARADLPRMPRPRGLHTALACSAQRHHPGEAGAAACSRGGRGPRPAACGGAHRAGPRTPRAVCRGCARGVRPRTPPPPHLPPGSFLEASKNGRE